MLQRLANVLLRQPGWVLVGAALLAAVAVAFGGRVSRYLKPFGFDDPASESVRAREELERLTGVRPGVAVVALVRAGADEAIPDEELQEAARRLEELGGERGVTLGGGTVAFREVDDIVEADLVRAELSPSRSSSSSPC